MGELDLREFQKMLEDAYEEYRVKTKDRHPSDNKFARWLGVSPATLNTWINGIRGPDMANAIQLSRKMGPGLFRVLGYPTVHLSNSLKLDFIMENLSCLTEEALKDILSVIEEDKKKRGV